LSIAATKQAKTPEADGAKPASADLFAAPEKRVLVLVLLLVVFPLALYNQATHFSFVNFDDDRYVTENPHVRGGLSWTTVKWAVTATDVANWHPVAWMSHALDYQWFRLNPAGHHLTSILLHALCGVILFLLLFRTTQRPGLSFFVAAVFALHPLNVESVVWISERKNVLSTLFFLATLWAYSWYAQKPGWKRYLGVAALFVCALASKSMVVTLPFVLLLLDYWPLRRIQPASDSEPSGLPRASFVKLLLEKLPLFVVSAAGCMTTMYAQKAAGAIGVLPFPLSVRLKNALCSYVLYIGKAVWPANLAPLYPHPGDSLAIWKAVLAASVLLTITALVVRSRSRGYLAVGWLWFLGTLVPVIGIVQVGNQAMADRYTYIPFIGLFIMITWGAADLAKSAKLGLPLQVAAATCAILALSVTTYRQAGYWRDSLTLWTHALAVTNDNFVAEDEFGGALVEVGRVEEAYPHFVRAAQLQPGDPVSQSNIGAYLQQHGHIEEALRQYELTASLTTDAPVLATTYANLGSVYFNIGNYAKARAAYEQSLRLNPNRYSAWIGVGLVAEREGNLQEAIRAFALSVELQPNVQAYFELGRTLAQSGHNPEALTAYGQALKLAPDLTAAQEAIATLRQQSVVSNPR
jgi:Flp pilus assembly protein TadD